MEKILYLTKTRNHIPRGLLLDASVIDQLTAKSEEIAQCNKLSKILNGGLTVHLSLAREASTEEISNCNRKGIRSGVILYARKAWFQYAVSVDSRIKNLMTSAPSANPHT